MSSTFSIHLNPALRRAIVRKYIISGSPVIPGDPSSVLHWRIFVNCAADGFYPTVKLDLMLGQDARTGFLMVTSVPYELSSTSVAHVFHGATNSITVDNLLQFLLGCGRDRYIYDDTGSGCRYWCRTVLGDLEGKGWVSSGACKEFDEYIVECNRQNSARFPLPTRQGTFY